MMRRTEKNLRPGCGRAETQSPGILSRELRLNTHPPNRRQMHFPLDMLRSTSASVSKAPLSKPRLFSFVPKFIGETTHRALRVAPWGFRVSQSRWWQMTNRQTLACTSPCHLSLYGLHQSVGWRKEGKGQRESEGRAGEESWERQRGSEKSAGWKQGPAHLY